MKDRRHGSDWLTRVLQGLVVLCWGGFIVLLSLYHHARPEIAYGFLVYGGIKVRTSWDPQFTPWLVYGLWRWTRATSTRSFISTTPMAPSTRTSATAGWMVSSTSSVHS